MALIIIGILLPRNSIVRPTIIAIKIICKEFPSIKGEKRLSGIMSSIISYRSENSNAAPPDADVLKNRANRTVITAPTITETRRNRPIIFLPILPKVAISPIPQMPQATDKKMMGPAIADSSPIKVSNRGVTSEADTKVDTLLGSIRQIQPRAIAARIAMPSCDI